MFATSSQRLNWIFPSEYEISKLKDEVNDEYIKRFSSDELNVSIPAVHSFKLPF